MMRVRVRYALGACLCVFATALPARAGAEESSQPFEIMPGSFSFGSSTSQAGSRGDWTIAFDVAHDANGKTHNDLRTAAVSFPAGFDASNTAVPTCSFAQLIGGSETLPACPIASQIGQIGFELQKPEPGRPPAHFIAPLYNMEVTSYGVAAEVGYKTVLYTEVMQVQVRPGDEGLTGTALNIPKVEPHNIKITLWALPASHVHDAQRGATCGEDFEVPPVCTHPTGPGGPQEAGIPVRPFLSNPTSCGSFQANLEVGSWEAPLSPPLTASAETASIDECDRVPFEPEIEVTPSTRATESPTGLDVSLVVPQAWENPDSISTANLKDATVALPEGMTANPGLASGLAACSPQQYADETALSLPGEGCPPESKIGSIDIETPLLAEKIPGSIYIATPYDNVPSFGDAEHPNGSLLALYVVAKDPQKGILIKVAGKITACEDTGERVASATCKAPGQLITTFDDNPQQPFSKFTLKFRPGATAPLISPPACGSYAPSAELTPWSTVQLPGETPVETRDVQSQPFPITEGIEHAPCPTGGIPPFKPEVISGTQNNAGGSYSPFYLRLLRHDGEQELVKFSTILAPGLTGNLTGVEKCSDASIAQAESPNRTGQDELEYPSCPASSEIGHTLVGAGVGTVLAQNPGKIYLAGPYHDAPLSIVSITSAKVGPFDLGTVVIRFALFINPITAQVEISGAASDPIPRIIDGIVVHVRDIRVYVDRPKFTIDPTNCNPMTIANAITGAGADPSNPADQQTVQVTTPFQAADCANLGFTPHFTAATSGKTSRSEGASLHVKLTYPSNSLGGQANIKSVKVDLPRQLPSRLTTLQKACTERQFAANPAACPTASRVGFAKAVTPLIPVPLEGPAYFVSHGGAKFPELVIVLQGYGITIDLHGETFINKAGITSSTFRTVPDQPVGSFELNLPEGSNSALAANTNLCASKLAMPTAFTGQNGAVLKQNTKIAVTGCKPAIRVVGHSVKGSHASIRVSVPSAGTLVASGGAVARSVKRVGEAKVVTIAVTLNKRDLRVLARNPRQRVNARVKLRFAPKHGKPLTAFVRLLMG